MLLATQSSHTSDKIHTHTHTLKQSEPSNKFLIHVYSAKQIKKSAVHFVGTVNNQSMQRSSYVAQCAAKDR